MSYDLEVYVRESADQAALVELTEGVTGLGVESSAESSMTVVRGKRAAYSFTADGPYDLDDEDVPDEVGAVLLGAKQLYRVHVEGSAEREIPFAVRWARALARQLDGAVVDLQDDSVWTRSTSRRIETPERHSRVSVIDLQWHCLVSDLPADPMRVFCDVVGVVLPEAMPRRFGDVEPMQGKFSEGGVGAFVEAWRETDFLIASCAQPCVGLSATGALELEDPPDWTLSLSFLAEPFFDPAWRSALRRLFVDLADGLRAFHASAAVTRGHIWTGRSLWSDGETEEAVLLSGHARWMGLSPQPTWWTWLGPPYAKYAKRLPADQTSATLRGVLHESAVAPAHADEGSPLSPHLPERLFARPRRVQEGQVGMSLWRASSIPRELDWPDPRGRQPFTEVLDMVEALPFDMDVELDEGSRDEQMAIQISDPHGVGVDIDILWIGTAQIASLGGVLTIELPDELEEIERLVETWMSSTSREEWRHRSQRIVVGEGDAALEYANSRMPLGRRDHDEPELRIYHPYRAGELDDETTG